MVLTDELIGVKNFLAKVAEKKGKAPAKEKIKYPNPAFWR